MKFNEKNYAGKDTEGEKYYINTHKRVLVKPYYYRFSAFGHSPGDLKSIGTFTKRDVRNALNIINNSSNGNIVESTLWRRMVSKDSSEIRIGCKRFTKYQFNKICNKVLSMK
jgi:hypothetical protein